MQRSITLTGKAASDIQLNQNGLVVRKLSNKELHINIGFPTQKRKSSLSII